MITETDVDLTHHEKVSHLELFFEKTLFSHRRLVLSLFAVLCVILGWQAAHILPEASFQKMIPTTHPYIVNYLHYENDLRKLGNSLRVVVENPTGNIYDAKFLATLKRVTDEVFYIPGVDRGNMKSLWTPNVLWRETTEDGFVAGEVIPQNFTGTSDDIQQVRANVLRAGIVGGLVSNDHHSAVVFVPLVETDPVSGNALDYALLSDRFEKQVRAKYEAAGYKIHIIGFAKIIGDLIEGAKAIAAFFLATFVMTAVLLYVYSRCWRSTVAAIATCTVAVIWQLGIVRLIGYGLDPYSILVPFLTFAIGVSHAVQNINTMAAQRAQGLNSLDASKATFRLLFIPGSIALLCDVVGFSTLLVIKIGVIQELAISATIGVAVIIVTKMFVLPVVMSYSGLSIRGIKHHQARMHPEKQRISRILSRVTEPKIATVVVLVGLATLATAQIIAKDLKVGDLDPGAPELRVDSRYNKDVAYLTQHYSSSPDVFAVIVKTKVDQCGAYAVADKVDRLQWELENLDGVESTASLFSEMKAIIAGANGGDLKWYSITRDRYISSSAHKLIRTELYNADCSMLTVLAFLQDHKAETLRRVTATVEAFASKNNDENAQFVLAAGSAGIEAVTNIVIEASISKMLILVYGIVTILVLWEFRSWRIAIALLFPLYVTSVLCEAIMVKLGLGVKVATLPVIALGVGIGVDYGIYLYNRLEYFLSKGMGLQEAYFETLKTTGKAIAVTGVTLALGVITWIESDIKFQADMGLLLAFMFLWNMIGAIFLMPAIICLLSPEAKRTAGTVNHSGESSLCVEPMPTDGVAQR